jgi:hypothetical protein
VRGRAGEPADYLVAFGDQGDGVHPYVGERGTERDDPGASFFGDLGVVELVDQFEVAAVEYLFDKALDHRLVRRHFAIGGGVVARHQVGLGAYMIVATPARQMVAPIRSHLSGRNPSTSMPQAREPTTKTPP